MFQAFSSAPSARLATSASWARCHFEMATASTARCLVACDAAADTDVAVPAGSLVDTAAEMADLVPNVECQCCAKGSQELDVAFA